MVPAGILMRPGPSLLTQFPARQSPAPAVKPAGTLDGGGQMATMDAIPPPLVMPKGLGRGYLFRGPRCPLNLPLPRPKGVPPRMRRPAGARRPGAEPGPGRAVRDLFASQSPAFSQRQPRSPQALEALEVGSVATAHRGATHRRMAAPRRESPPAVQGSQQPRRRPRPDLAAAPSRRRLRTNAAH